jgi:hypothetical protein
MCPLKIFGRILGPTKSPIQWVRGSFLGLTFQGKETDRLPFYSAEVPKASSYIYSPLVQLNSLHRGKCISTFQNISCFNVTETGTTSTERLKMWFFWCVASFRLAEECKRFGGTFCVGSFCPTLEVAFFWIFISLIKRGHNQVSGTLWRSWLRHCATSRKVAGSIPDDLIGIFHWHNPSGHTMVLGST